MDFELDPSGLLLRPNIHDGYLLGIELPQDRVARLTVRNLAGQHFHIELDGLERLRCDSFAEGNIVGELIVTTGRSPPDFALRRLLLGASAPAAPEPYASQHAAWVKGVRDAVVAGEKTFVELTSSYGADVSALCATVRVREF
jgi:hypothetical protein